MKRMIQYHAIIKDHTDGQHTNALLRNTREDFQRLGVATSARMCCNNKNKVKGGPTGESLALATCCRKKFVP